MSALYHIPPWWCDNRMFRGRGDDRRLNLHERGFPQHPQPRTRASLTKEYAIVASLVGRSRDSERSSALAGGGCANLAFSTIRS
eukprot:860625-Prymnesium_polylepis.1